jgi:hypothetical protein
VSLPSFPSLSVRFGFFGMAEVDGLEVDDLLSDLSDLSDDLEVEVDFVDDVVVVVDCRDSWEVSVFHSQ